MKSIISIFLLALSIQLQAQSTINGIVTDAKGNPIPEANVYLEGTYDGSTTDDSGVFSFTTSETGSQTLVVSFL